MATRATGPLSSQIQSQGGSSVSSFCSLFDGWKSGFPATEYTNFGFGKDGAYATPTVDGKRYQLRHVHLAPVSDKTELAKWSSAFAKGTQRGKWSKRTGNRVLVYASQPLPKGPKGEKTIC